MRNFFIVSVVIICVFLNLSIPQYVFAVSDDVRRTDVVSKGADPLVDAEYGVEVFTQPVDDFLLPNDYRKDRIIIRFKEGSGLGAVAADLVNEKMKFETVTGDWALDSINEMYGVVAIKPLITSELFSLQTKKTTRFSSDIAQALEIRRNAHIATSIVGMNARYPDRARYADSAKQIAIATKLSNTFIVTFDADKDNLQEIKAAYMQDSAVVEAELIQAVYVNFEPTDPYYSSSGSWGQDFSDMYGLRPDFLHCGDPVEDEGAWAQSKGEGIVVAVIDSGVDYNHPDLVDNMWQDAEGHYGYDFANGDDNPIDDHGHGTHCAGTIAAVENGFGVIGVAPSAKIMAIKGLKASGRGYTDVLSAAIMYAVENGADILSNSWGGGGNSGLLTEAFDYAHASGCVSVAAAGNSARDAAYFTPAGIQSVITVAASDSNHERASFSNIGTKIDVSAPGVDILSLRAAGTDMYGTGTHIVNDDYYYASGTSMACPHVAGVLAVIKSANPDYSNEELRSALRASATDLGAIGFDTQFGSGLANADAALDIVSPIAANIFSIEQIDNQTIEVRGVVYGDSFSSYFLEYAESLEGPWMTADNIVPGEKQGTLNPDGNISYPVLGTVDPEGLSGFVYVRLTGYDQSNDSYQDFINTIIIEEQKSGWPVNVFDEEQGISAYPIFSSPMVANIDNSADGSEEVIVNAIGGLFVYDANGTILSGWPKNYLWPQGSGGFSTPAIADLDGDGDMEIIAMGYDGSGSVGDLTIFGTNEPVAGLHIWHHDGSRYNDQWPQTLENHLPGLLRLTYLGYSSPSVGDIDADGAQEIVIAVRYGAGMGGETRCALLAFEQDGSLVVDSQNTTQWPRFLSVNNILSGRLLECSPTPLLIDLNHDGMLEIVQGVNFRNQSVIPREYYSEIKVFDAYGNTPENTQWPWISDTVTLGNKNLVAGDVNGDGDIEIIAQTSSGAVGYPTTKIFSCEGDEIASIGAWATLSANFSLADMNDDGTPEIIYITQNRKLYVSSLEGDQLVPLPGWPKVYQTALVFGNTVPSAGPSIADVDGDGYADIVVIANAGSDNPYASLKAFDRYGNLLNGWPKYVQPFDLIYSQPTITDMDNDGQVDVLVGNLFGQVLAYGLEYQFNPEAQEWPMFQKNLKHSGVHGEEPVVPNYVPTAYAGPDITIDENIEVVLVGSGYDPDGFIVNYAWEQIDGPEVTLENANEATASFSAPAVEDTTSITFKLTVTDNDDATASDVVFVTVTNVNMAPVADAGEDVAANELSVVTLAGSGYDPDGFIVSYAWKQIDGPDVVLENSNEATVSFSAPAVSELTELTFKLTVTDDDDVTASDEVVVIVNNINVVPVANAGVDQQEALTFPNISASIILDGTASSDPDGTIESYLWTEGDDQLGTGVTPAVDLTVGVHIITLIVTDNDGASDIDDVEIIINQAPIANAGVDQQEALTFPNISASIILDGTASSDPDGTIESYVWTEGDDQLGTGVTPTVDLAEGVHTITLTVTDDDGSIGTDDVEIIINPAGNQVPIADAGEDQKGYAWYPMTLDATQSYDPDSGPELLTYAWQQIDGPVEVMFVLDQEGIISFEAPLVHETTNFIFRVTVSDGIDSSEDTVQVFVEPNTLPQKEQSRMLFSVYENEKFTYDLTENIFDRETTPLLGYTWEQVSGVPVTEGGVHDGQTMVFATPSVASTQNCMFRVLVHDGSKDISYHIAIRVLNVDQ